MSMEVPYVENERSHYHRRGVVAVEAARRRAAAERNDDGCGLAQRHPQLASRIVVTSDTANTWLFKRQH